jgi:hypothetical protein
MQLGKLETDATYFLSPQRITPAESPSGPPAASCAGSPYGLILPRTTARRAPVALGRFDARRLHVS